MGKNIDFVFIYEVKSREIENICLLKCELENRGYTVELLNTWFYLTKLPPKYNAKVVVTFAMYNDETFKFISTYVSKIYKVVNLQWEQVGSNKEETDINSLFFLKGLAKNCVNICWGNITYNRLKDECKIDENNLSLTGHISIDFLKPENRKYYFQKKELFDKYNIPINQKVCLFISSFSYVNLPEHLASQSGSTFEELSEFIQISMKSQNIIIDWISNLLTINEDVVFIYRPHPAESNNYKLKQLAEKHFNFRVIGELSAKQWILTTDITYLWYSTSLAEVYFAGKPCHILRPIKLSNERELGIYDSDSFISEYDDFEASVKRKEYSFPVSVEKLNSYYYVDPIEPTYIKICDKLIEVLSSNSYILPEVQSTQKNSIGIKIKTYLSRSSVKLKVDKLGIKLGIKSKYFIQKKANYENGTYAYYQQMTYQNYVARSEIETIEKKIKQVFNIKNSKEDSIIE